MNWKISKGLVALLFAGLAHYTNQVQAAECTESNAVLTPDSRAVFAGAQIKLTYSATRNSCTSAGSYSVPILIGAGTGQEAGKCGGVRTKEAASCSGTVTAPAGFTGPLVLTVGDTLTEVIVQAAIAQPTARDIEISVAEDQPAIVPLTLGGEGVTAEQFEVLDTPDSAIGQVKVEGSTLTFTQVPGWSGIVALQYRGRDQHGTYSNKATIRIITTGRNDPPVVIAQPVIMTEDAQMTFEPTVQDPDAVDIYRLVIEAQGKGVAGEVLADGHRIKLTPKPDFYGQDVLRISAVDVAGAKSAVVDIPITVQGVNDAPVAQPISIVTDEDTPGRAKIVFTDPDGDGPYQFVVSGQPGASIGGCGLDGDSVVFTPAPDWNGKTTCQVAVIDAGSAASAPVPVSITVTPVADKPVVESKTVTLNQGATSSFTLQVSDVDANDTATLRAVSAADPAFGSVSFTGTTAKVSLNATFVGTREIRYVAKDSFGLDSDEGVILVRVLPVAQAPVVDAASAKTAMETPVTVELTATDPNHDAPLTFAIQQPVAAAAGTVSLAGSLLTFKPATGYLGTASAKVTATDPGGLVSAAQTIAFEVVGDQVIGTDPDNPDSHTVVIVQQPDPSVGKITTEGLRVRFVPVDGYVGTATFKYKLRDAAGAESAIKDGAIQVDKTNYAPSAANAALVANEGQASAPVTPEVVDKNLYDAGKHTFAVPIQEMRGTAEVVNNQLVYHAPFGSKGTTSFKFIARDPAGAEVVGTATVTVRGRNVGPTRVGLSLVTEEGVEVSGTPTVVDPNPGDTFTFAVPATSAGGTVKVLNGQVVYMPKPGWTGTESFPITATDAGGESGKGTVTVVVKPRNLAPESLSGSIVVREGTASAPYYPRIVDRNVADAGRHSLRLVQQAANGGLAIVENRLVYTPAASFVGTDSAVIEATDPGGLTVQGTIALQVDRFNLAPVAATLRIRTVENAASAATLPKVTDGNAWDSFTYEVVEQPKSGTVVATAAGYVYTPNPHFVGNDLFRFRVVDKGGEYVEAMATVAVAQLNTAPTGLTPSVVYFYEGVGGSQRLAAIDDNTWGSHTFSVATQPEHGYVWFTGDELHFSTDGRTATTVSVTVTDQDGAAATFPVRLAPRSLDDPFDKLPVKELSPSAFSTPAITKEFTHLDGRPGLVITDQQALAELGTDIIAMVERKSEVGLRVGRRPLERGQGARLAMDRVMNGSLGAAVAALQSGAAGHGRILLARADLTGTVYAVPFEVWKLTGELKATPATIGLGLESARIQFSASNSVCTNTVREVSARDSNPYDKPVCLLQFTKPMPEAKDLSSDGLLLQQGFAAEAGTYPVEAAAYIVDDKGEKSLLATYPTQVNVVPMAGAVKMTSKYPMDTVYAQVQDRDIEFVQSAGPTCDLTVIERRAITAAASYSTRPTCLVEWTEIPPGLAIRENWEKPVLRGAVTMLGSNRIAWKLSSFTPSGKKIDLGTDQFVFTAKQPTAPVVTYKGAQQLGDTLLAAPISGGYAGDATVTAVSARLTLTHNLNQGDSITEDINPVNGDVSTQLRRIYAAPFSTLWQRRPLAVDVAYTALPNIATHSDLTVLSVPDANIMPVIDNENGKILSTDALEVGVTMGDAYDSQVPYDSATMGEWEIRLVQRPDWNTVEEIAGWVRADGAGHAAFEVPVEKLAGKNLRVYAEARVVSPEPAYQETRTSPRPLSIVILNGAALDGSVRALRLTGEAPMRVTLFAEVNNRSWARDLGNVRWEMSTNGGEWQTVSNPSNAPQRLATTLQKGSYMIRAELTNKNSGAKSMTQAIEINAFNIPKGYLAGPGNTFVDAQATFQLKQSEKGDVMDLSNIEAQWSLDKGVTWFAGNDSYSVTRSAEERVYVFSRVRFKDAPADDPLAWKLLRGGVAFRKVKPPRVQLVGNRRPEVGKESTWVARLVMPYTNMDLKASGEFIMPDGTSIVPGTTAAFTPTEEDVTDKPTYITYRAWIEGYRDKGGEGLTQQRLTYWEYEWPKWELQPSLSAAYVPATLTLRMRNLGQFKALENVKYDWELPKVDGYTVANETNETLRILEMSKAAAYPFKVHVSDGRGNYSTVERTVTLLDPPPWTVSLRWTGDNNATRAPLKVLVMPSISGGHPKDKVLSMRYTLGGKQIDTNGSRYARATLESEGEYQIALQIETQMQKTAESEVVIDVKENQPPKCELDVKESSSSWRANANCKDPDGRISRHHWFVNDEKQGLSGSVITISKRTYPQAPHIVLTATDDAGADSEPVEW